MKRKRPVDDEAPPPVEKPTVGQLTSHIGNKQVRSEAYGKLKAAKKKEKKARRTQRDKAAAKAIERGEEPAPMAIPRTIENTRELVEDTPRTADEVAAAEADDEFADHFARARAPKVLVTTCYRPTAAMYRFLTELLQVLPAAQFYKRAGFPLKKIVEYAAKREYSDVLVVNEDRKAVNGLLVVHLPAGPSVHFKLSKLVLGADIPGHGRPTSHKPELILNNFDTMLGRRVGRLFASLFCQDPNFRGRRVVTFHNQRDYIFFRHHRYIFEEKERREPGQREKKKRMVARLQELGPRFTLKLLSMQKGLWDPRHAEYEHKWKADMNVNRRRFYL